MSVPEPWPLEAVFGVVVVWSGLIGLFLMGVEALTGAIRVDPLTGFFNMLTRVSFVAVVAAILWKNAVLLGAFQDWREFAFRLLLILMFAFMIFANVIILTERVLTDRYGSRGTSANL